MIQQKIKNKYLLNTISICSISFFLFLWEWFYRSESVISNLFPPPTILLETLLSTDFKIGIGSQAQTITYSIFSSLSRVYIGLFLGFFLAIIIGGLIFINPYLNAFFSPIIRLLAPIAPIAWIPLALVIFGIGNTTAIFIVFMGVFFTLTISTTSALNSVPSNRIEMAKGLGANKIQIWRFIIIPSILPHVFFSLRLNFIAAWMAVLAAEMTGLQDGVGAILMIGRNLFNYKLIMIGMVLIGILGALSDILLSTLQRKLLWWNER